MWKSNRKQDTRRNVKLGIGLMVLPLLLMTGCLRGGGAALKANPQTIQFGAAPSLSYPGTATVTATASSGLAVSYSTITATVCSVSSSGLVTANSAGTCTIAADQAGNADFAPAVQVTQSMSVTNPVQAITFGTAPTISIYGAGIVTATASSGLSVSYSSLTPSVCAVNSSGVVSALAAGSCTVAADQAGNTFYLAAAQVTQIITVPAWSGALAVPGAPAGVTATMGTVANTVQASFIGPASSGGSPVTGYTVTSSPAGMTATGTAAPLTLTCPVTCNGYAFSVAATNAVGTGAQSATADVLTGYNVTATFYEPATQPNDSIFTGSFTLDATTGTVTNLKGSLTQSMTGPPMSSVPLVYQLSAVSDGAGGLRVTTFALNTTHTFSEGGFAPGSPGLYYGFPSATNPANGGSGNAYAMIYVNLANPLAAPTTAQINKLAYADCTALGMMGDTCMTGYVGVGTMGGYPVSQTITRQ